MGNLIIIFENKELADELLKEIACTSNDLVYCWYDPELQIETYPNNAISYNICVDGRVAIFYHGSAEDIVWLQTYLEDQEGVSFADQLPEGWVCETLI